MRTIVIDTDGDLSFLYHDDLQPIMLTLGEATIKRASMVEPTDDGLWTADMGPSDGPVLGPFVTRAEALDAEEDWLHRNVLGA